MSVLTGGHQITAMEAQVFQISQMHNIFGAHKNKVNPNESEY